LIVGLDANILCYSLDPAYPEHKYLRNLLLNLSPDNMVAVNPTVIHETYHVLVFSQKWVPSEAAKRLHMILEHPYIKFLGQTLSDIGLDLAVNYGLGGRDSLILANFIMNRVPVMYTHDDELLLLEKVEWKGFTIRLVDPLKQGFSP